MNRIKLYVLGLMSATILLLAAACGGGGGGGSPSSGGGSTAASAAFFYVESSGVYSAASSPVTIYVPNLNGASNTVAIVAAGTTTPATVLQASGVTGQPNQVQAIIPAGMAAGTYDLEVTNGATGTHGTLANAITVTSTPSVALKSVTTPFAVNTVYTKVTILRDFANATLTTPFQATPLLYLYPAAPAPADVAIAVSSVTYVDSNTVTAVIPPGIPAKIYDVILVNPDGSVGVLTSGLTIQSAAAPVIASAVPNTIVSQTGQIVTLAGTGFSTSSIAASCKSGLSPAVTSGSLTCAGGQCTQQATIDASTLAFGDVCVLRVTNADGSYGETPISVSNPSLNLTSVAGTQLNTGRRAPVAGGGTVTPGNYVVYAIGGDAGTVVSPYSSVEMAPVDAFGTMGAWQTLANTLNTARTLAGSSTIGRYIYVFGGNNGTGVVNTAERAMILDPSEVPHASLADLPASATGLPGGTYIYSVAATFSASDADNPNGESLPSQDVVVNVPTLGGTLAGQSPQAVLAWTAPVDNQGVALPNVSGYRIYRTNANGGAGTKTLLATVYGSGTLTYTDDGTVAPGTATPQVFGALGNWYALPAMATARQGIGAAAAQDPVTPNVWYVYALLGQDGSGTNLGTYEYLTVTIQANGHQTVGLSWTAGASSSASARWQVGGWTATSATTSNIPASTSYVYLGGGLGTGTTLVNAVEAGKVAAGGDLGTLAAVSGTISAAGYGVFAENDQLFAFGGGSGTYSSGIKSAVITNPVPTLGAGAWALANGMTDSRYLPGSVALGPFAFIIGGQSATAAATKTTEQAW